MYPRKAPYKPSRTSWFFGFLEELDLLYHHAFVYGLAHIIDGQRSHANSGEGLHLDAGTVARMGRRGDRHAVLAYLELDVSGGQIQPVTKRYELWRLLGRHHTGDPGRIQHVSLGQCSLPQQPYRLRRHAHDSPGHGGAPHHFLLPHVDHPGRALAVEVRKVHLPPFGLLSNSASQHTRCRALTSACAFPTLAEMLTRRRSHRTDKPRP